MARKPAVAGSWYPGTARELGAAVDRYLNAAGGARALSSVAAIIAPHAGLMYSGPVAAHAYRQLQGRDADVAVLVGPSHFIGFDGVAMYRGGFDSPLGIAEIDDECASALLDATP